MLYKVQKIQKDPSINNKYEQINLIKLNENRFKKKSDNNKEITKRTLMRNEKLWLIP